MSNTNIHILSRAVIINQGHILLCKTTDLKDNFYYLPGGHVEHAESVESTVVRELFEEAGVKIEIKRFLGCLEYSFPIQYSNMCHNHEYTFFFEAMSDELSVNQKNISLEKNLELVWIPYDTISKIDLKPVLLKILLPQWLNTSISEDMFYSEVI